MNKNQIIAQVAADEPAPTGNHRFEGFCVDLLEHIAQQVGCVDTNKNTINLLKYMHVTLKNHLMH